MPWVSRATKAEAEPSVAVELREAFGEDEDAMEEDDDDDCVA